MTNYFKSKKVLITGGLGFIGSNLAIRLVKEGANVTLVDSLVPEYGGNLFNVKEIKSKVDINISDVRDEHSMKFLLQGQDYLFNLAGQTSHMDSMKNPQTDLEINCRAQISILETCRNFNPEIKVVFASTRQVYGKPDYLPVNEQHPIRPVDVNGINKIAGEWYHILYNNVYGIKACALRLTNTYGPRMRIKDARQTFLGIWIRLVLEGMPIEIWGGEQLRDFNYIDDCVSALMYAAASKKAYGKVFNLGDHERISLKALAKLLITINGSGEYIVKTFPEDRKKIDIGDYYSDFDYFTRTVGWKPKVGITIGIKETLAYFRLHLKNYL